MTRAPEHMTMTTDASRAGQRAEWKRQLARAAAVKRSGRVRRKPPRLRPGVLRRAGQRTRNRDVRPDQPDGSKEGRSTCQP
jgi:hypothetical protein